MFAWRKIIFVWHGMIFEKKKIWGPRWLKAEDLWRPLFLGLRPSAGLKSRPSAFSLRPSASTSLFCLLDFQPLWIWNLDPKSDWKSCEWNNPSSKGYVMSCMTRIFYCLYFITWMSVLDTEYFSVLNWTALMGTKRPVLEFESPKNADYFLKIENNWKVLRQVMNRVRFFFFHFLSPLLVYHCIAYF